MTIQLSRIVVNAPSPKGRRLRRKERRRLSGSVSINYGMSCRLAKQSAVPMRLKIVALSGPKARDADA